MEYTYTVHSMFLTINTDDARPIYQQVADGIKELIARGKLPQGTALPPVRQLAGDLSQPQHNRNGLSRTAKRRVARGEAWLRVGGGIADQYGRAQSGRTVAPAAHGADANGARGSAGKQDFATGHQ